MYYCQLKSVNRDVPGIIIEICDLKKKNDNNNNSLDVNEMHFF